MLLLPRWLVSLITFPGVVIHEFAHKKFCDWTHVPVRKVRYFRFGDPAGYVEHDEPDFFYQTFFISVGPLIINSAVAVLLAYLAVRLHPRFDAGVLMLWVGFAAGACAFPSDEDMRHIVDKGSANLRNGGSFLYILSYPFFALIWLANKLRYVYFDFLYAFVLVMVGLSL